jgi:hypothetical protein
VLPLDWLSIRLGIVSSAPYQSVVECGGGWPFQFLRLAAVITIAIHLTENLKGMWIISQPISGDVTL